jgi:hypothetical protein
MTPHPARFGFEGSMKQVLVALFTMALPLTAAAHHSFLSRFDRTTLAEIEGEITELLWRNPHTYLTIRSEGPNGEATDWEIETSSLSVMRRLGIEGAMKTGDRIRIAGYPPVGDRHEMYARHVLLPSGTELLMDTGLKPRWTGPTAGQGSLLAINEGDGSRPELGIFRTWSFIRTSRRLFPEAVDPAFDVQSYPMTDAARAALAAFDIERDRPTGDCAPKGMPTVMEQPYPVQFSESPGGDILLRIEEYDLQRIIYMDETQAPANPEPSLLGLSLGHWDGRTLSVTTTRISWPYFSQVGIPQSSLVELIERFTPTADGSRLDYELTVTDPETFTRPVTTGMYWIWVPSIELLPFDCNER